MKEDCRFEVVAVAEAVADSLEALDSAVESLGLGIGNPVIEV